jgi:hypothetical protein
MKISKFGFLLKKKNQKVQITFFAYRNESGTFLHAKS